jgi:hypothetical protein
MPSPHQFVSSHRWPHRARAGAVAGVAAAAVYAVEQELDLRAFRHNADDLILVGGLVASERARARQIGLACHLINGAVLGAAYAGSVQHRLPGTPAARGVIFALAENFGLYPLALLEERHPAIRNGILARYWNRTAFCQSILRHIAFGAVLGPLTDRRLCR